MIESLRSQFQIIVALTILEMQNQNTKLQLGYAWAVIDVLIYVGIISILRVFINAFMPPNMPPLTFLILGILPWLVFMRTFKGIETVITKSKKLLVIPIVTPLDIVLAKALQILSLYSAVFLGLVTFSAIYEGAGAPRFPLGIILAFLASWVLGLSLGLALIPLHRMFPPAKSFLMLIVRVGVLTSGVYFVITSLPPGTWPYMTWNPLLHIIEIMRTDWFSTYNSPIASPVFIAECIAGMLLFGLALERIIRRVPA